MGNPNLPGSLRRTTDQWERLAADDPFWAILAEPDKKNGGWDEDAFFQSGIEAVDGEMSHLRRALNGLGEERALDFGCGVGRLTQGLARHFNHVVGVDVSANMIRLAETFNRHPKRVTYTHNPYADLRAFDEDHFDLVFSLITLQHVSRRHAVRYIAEFVRIARPGGIILFQVPAHRVRESSFRLRWRRRVLNGIGRLNRSLLINRRPYFEMHMMPESLIRRILKKAGATVIEVSGNSAAGERYLSRVYLARKERSTIDQNLSGAPLAQAPFDQATASGHQDIVEPMVDGGHPTNQGNEPEDDDQQAGPSQ